MPLATGFLWLAVLWLVTYSIIPTRAEASGLAAEVYTLIGAFGPAALLAVISFMAYVLGILLSRPGTAIVESLLGISSTNGPRLSASSRIQSRQLADRTASAMVQAGVSPPKDDGESAMLTNPLAIEYESSASELAQVESQVVIARQLGEQMNGEIGLVATRLLAENRDLFDRYDRAEAEASFRFSICAPLLVFSALVPWRLELDWWGYILSVGVGIGVCIALVIEGARKQMESNDAIFQAVFSEKADFPSIETARAAITQKRELDQRRNQDRIARQAQRREEAKALQETFKRAQAAASLVTIAVRGGAGQGSPPHVQLTSVHIDITNDTDQVVIIDKFELDPPLVATGYPRFPLRIQSHHTDSQLTKVEPIGVNAKDLSGEPLPGMSASITYRAGDRKWIRSSRENSVPDPIDSSPVLQTPLP